MAWLVDLCPEATIAVELFGKSSIAMIAVYVRLSVRDVYCAKMVQDSPIVCIEIEQKYAVKISVGTFFDPL